MKKRLTRPPVLIVICLIAVVSVGVSLDISINDDAHSGEVVLGIQTEVGIDYVLYGSEDLKTWTPINDLITGDGRYQEVRIATSKSAEFFRITKAAYWDEFLWGEFTWQ